MRNIIVIAGLLLAFTAMAGNAQSKQKQKKKYVKQVVSIERAVAEEKPKPVTIVNPALQLYGEWTIIEIQNKAVYTQERPYIYIDFNGKKFYGNNGCNAINGNFTLKGNAIAFNNIISTNQTCSSTTSELTVMRNFAEVRTFELSSLYNVEYMSLKNANGKVIMKLRRQNLDFLNGAWTVKEMAGQNVFDRNVKLVIDVQMKTVNCLTKCNIINGIVKIDPIKEFDVEFEDLKSTHHMCDDIRTETQMLICLEETVSCKKINNSEMALMNHRGTIVMVLKKHDLRAARNTAKK